MEAVASGAPRVQNFFYVADINPRGNERLTPEQWAEAIDRLEHNLGLDGQPRFVVEHEKDDGRVHRHVVWLRVDINTMKAISDSLTARIHERTARELEEAFGLAHTDSVLVPGREPGRTRTPEDYAMFRAQDGGLDPRTVTAEVTELWQSADSGKAFAAALAAHGYTLARGDRRDFVIIDPAGDEHSLARRISGARAADVRSRMVDVDRDSLPSVAEAKELWREVVEHAEMLARTGGLGQAVEAQQPEEEPEPERREREIIASGGENWLFNRYGKLFQRDIEERGEINHGDGFSWWERTVAVVLQWRDTAIEWAREGWQRILDVWNGPNDPDHGDPDHDGPDFGR
jgi:hypothetical protein